MLSFLGEGISFLWGVVKLYNVLGGYDCIIATPLQKVCTNLTKILVIFCGILPYVK